VVQLRTYRLTRNFAIASAGIVLLAAVTLGYMSRTMAVEQLRLLAEQNNQSLTHAFANGVWQRFAAFVGSAHRLPADDIRAHPQRMELQQTIQTLMAGT